jgi:hypothetical protein
MRQNQKNLIREDAKDELQMCMADHDVPNLDNRLLTALYPRRKEIQTFQLKKPR